MHRCPFLPCVRREEEAGLSCFKAEAFKLLACREMLSSSAAMGMGMGLGGYGQQQQMQMQRGAGPVFTPAQWAELEQQALIYKYLMAGVPVPPDLLLPIRPHPAGAGTTFSFANPAASPFYHHHHPSSKQPPFPPLSLSLYLFVRCRESRGNGLMLPVFLGNGGTLMLNGIDLL